MGQFTTACLILGGAGAGVLNISMKWVDLLDEISGEGSCCAGFSQGLGLN